MTERLAAQLVERLLLRVVYALDQRFPKLCGHETILDFTHNAGTHMQIKLLSYRKIATCKAQAYVRLFILIYCLTTCVVSS
jgi:hypothetical protein